VASATKDILELIRDELSQTGTIRELVGEKIFVMLDPNTAPPDAQCVPPFIIVSPGDVRTSRGMGDPANRQEIVQVSVTAYVMYAVEEERLLMGPRGEPGLLDIIDAIDTLVDNAHRSGYFMSGYERCDKTGEGGALPAYTDEENPLHFYARKTISFEIEAWQNR